MDRPGSPQTTPTAAASEAWPEPMGLRLSLQDLTLLAIARKTLDPWAASLLHRVTHEPMDWAHFVEAADWQKLQGFMYKHLSLPEFANHAPASVLELLRARYKQNVARQMFFEHELKQILSALNETGISVIVMKGAALVPEIYDGDAGLRPMADIDLIVQSDRALEADQRLRKMGFRPSVSEQEQLSMRLIDRQLAALARPGSPVIIELHTHLVGADSPIRFDIQKLWDRIVPTETAGESHYVLDPTALLVAQSVNFLKDRRFYSYSALGQLCDVAEVVRKYHDHIEWDAFRPGGAFAELKGVVFGSVYAAHHLLQAPVPESALAQLKPARFNPNMAAKLVRSRVLGRDWLAKDLDSSHGIALAWKLPLGMFKRVFLTRSQLEYRSDHGKSVSRRDIVFANMKRIGSTAKFAAHSVVRPRRLYEDVSVDRWLKSLYEPD